MSAPSSSTSHEALDPADPLVYDAVWESNPHIAQSAGWPPDRRRTFVCFFNFPAADPTRAHEVATPGSLDGVPWIYMLPVPHQYASSDSAMRERKLSAIEPSANPGTQRRTSSSRNTPPHMAYLLHSHSNNTRIRDKKGAYRG